MNRVSNTTKGLGQCSNDDTNISVDRRRSKAVSSVSSAGYRSSESGVTTSYGTIRNGRSPSPSKNRFSSSSVNSSTIFNRNRSRTSRSSKSTYSSSLRGAQAKPQKSKTSNNRPKSRDTVHREIVQATGTSKSEVQDIAPVMHYAVRKKNNNNNATDNSNNVETANQSQGRTAVKKRGFFSKVLRAIKAPPAVSVEVQTEAPKPLPRKRFVDKSISTGSIGRERRRAQKFTDIEYQYLLHDAAHAKASQHHKPTVYTVQHDTKPKWNPIQSNHSHVADNRGSPYFQFQYVGMKPDKKRSRKAGNFIITPVEYVESKPKLAIGKRTQSSKKINKKPSIINNKTSKTSELEEIEMRTEDLKNRKRKEMNKSSKTRNRSTESKKSFSQMKTNGSGKSLKSNTKSNTSTNKMRRSGSVKSNGSTKSVKISSSTKNTSKQKKNKAVSDVKNFGSVSSMKRSSSTKSNIKTLVKNVKKEPVSKGAISKIKPTESKTKFKELKSKLKDESAKEETETEAEEPVKLSKKEVKREKAAAKRIVKMEDTEPSDTEDIIVESSKKDSKKNSNKKQKHDEKLKETHDDTLADHKNDDPKLFGSKKLGRKLSKHDKKSDADKTSDESEDDHHKYEMNKKDKKKRKNKDSKSDHSVEFKTDESLNEKKSAKKKNNAVKGEKKEVETVDHDVDNEDHNAPKNNDKKLDPRKPKENTAESKKKKMVMETDVAVHCVEAIRFDPSKISTTLLNQSEETKLNHLNQDGSPKQFQHHSILKPQVSNIIRSHDKPEEPPLGKTKINAASNTIDSLNQDKPPRKKRPTKRSCSSIKGFFGRPKVSRHRRSTESFTCASVQTERIVVPEKIILPRPSSCTQTDISIAAKTTELEELVRDICSPKPSLVSPIVHVSSIMPLDTPITTPGLKQSSTNSMPPMKRSLYKVSLPSDEDLSKPDSKGRLSLLIVPPLPSLPPPPIGSSHKNLMAALPPIIKKSSMKIKSNTSSRIVSPVRSQHGNLQRKPLPVCTNVSTRSIKLNSKKSQSNSVKSGNKSGKGEITSTRKRTISHHTVASTQRIAYNNNTLKEKTFKHKATPRSSIHGAIAAYTPARCTTPRLYNVKPVVNTNLKSTTHTNLKKIAKKSRTAGGGHIVSPSDSNELCRKYEEVNIKHSKDSNQTSSIGDMSLKSYSAISASAVSGTDSLPSTLREIDVLMEDPDYTSEQLSSASNLHSGEEDQATCPSMNSMSQNCKGLIILKRVGSENMEFPAMDSNMLRYNSESQSRGIFRPMSIRASRIQNSQSGFNLRMDETVYDDYQQRK